MQNISHLCYVLEMEKLGMSGYLFMICLLKDVGNNAFGVQLVTLTLKDKLFANGLVVMNGFVLTVASTFWQVPSLVNFAVGVVLI
jgi:hypothetical protein